MWLGDVVRVGDKIRHHHLQVLANKLHVKDTRTYIQKPKKYFIFRDAPMLVTHWMEAGIGTLSFVDPSAAVWNHVRASL